uniref:Uncharacterized protein n=1 Tax=Oryza nivara TaxID=4536 RepID=A0A0E0J8Y9_ORYNI
MRTRLVELLGSFTPKEWGGIGIGKGKRWPEVRKTMLISHLGCGGHDGSVARSGVVHSGQNSDEIMAAVLGACSRADNGMATFPSLQWMK